MFLFSPADGPPIIAHYDISDTNSDAEVVNVDNLLAAAVVQEHNNSLVNQDSGSSWRSRGLLDELSTDTGLFKFSSSNICCSITVSVSPFPAYLEYFLSLYSFKSSFCEFCNNSAQVLI